MDSIFHRTSIRQYLQRNVEEGKITEMLKAAMAAPSAGNQQPCEVYVVKDKQKLRELADTSPYAGCTANAPMAFVVCYQNKCRMPEYAQIEERMEAVKRVLAIPDTLSAFAIVPCGYPAEEKVQQDRFDLTKIH
jgi:nitroreductase